jgi:lipid-binding SYLF domain-containing protein
MRFQATKRVVSAMTVLLTTIGLVRTGYASDQDLVGDAQRTMDKYRRADPGIDSFIRHSAGYVVFPGIGKGGLGVGGAHGTGVLFEDGVPTGKVTMNQVTIGAQAGGQEFSEVIFFQTPQVLADFRQGKVKMSAEVSAVALSAGAAAKAKFTNGVAVFTQMKGGLMAEASIGGQKFKYEPFGR